MISGRILAVLAGSLVSLQNIFNSKVNERAGSWATTALVLGMGFLASLVIGLLFEGAELSVLEKMQPWYWFSGLIGVGVVICLVQGIRLLGPTYASSVVLSAQLGFALLWVSLGWFGLEQVPFTFKQVVGVLVLVGGIIVFKFGGKHEAQERPSSQRRYPLRFLAGDDLCAHSVFVIGNSCHPFASSPWRLRSGIFYWAGGYCHYSLTANSQRITPATAAPSRSSTAHIVLFPCCFACTCS